MTTYDTTPIFAEGIHTEDFDLIPPGQDLYISDLTGNRLVQVAADNFTNYVGQLLITDGGDFGGAHHPAKFFAVRWDAAKTNFVVKHLLTYTNDVEHVTFAPIHLPPLTP